jgi:hypothetical protein
LGSLLWISNSSEDVLAKPEKGEQHLATVFSELRAIEPMLASKSYTVRVAGELETGTKERFLRRRTAQEIRSSELSSGCGDYAILFVELVEALGFETLLVDAAEISSTNLRYNFAGHVVVAIRNQNLPSNAPWWLVDPTSRRVLSRNWSPKEKSFEVSGGVYWIGYCGPLSDYPVDDGQELSEFYAKTLNRVPKSVLERTLYRFTFDVDRSLINLKGEYLNPRLDRFIREQSTILEEYGIAPEREVSVTLKRGGEDSISQLTYSEENGWVNTVGLKSGCSPSMFAGLERNVRRQHERSSRAKMPPK